MEVLSSLDGSEVVWSLSSSETVAVEVGVSLSLSEVEAIKVSPSLSEIDVLEVEISLSEVRMVDMGSSLSDMEGSRFVEGRSLTGTLEGVKGELASVSVTVDEGVIAELRSRFVSSVLAERH